VTLDSWQKGGGNTPFRTIIMHARLPFLRIGPLAILLLGWALYRAEADTVETPAATDNPSALANVASTTGEAVIADEADFSRYRQYNGQWWYLLPNNHWVVWDDGQWVEPQRETTIPEAESVMHYHAPRAYHAHVHSPAARIMQPRPKSWYFTGGIYDGPYYYFDEFYKPYGGARPYPYFPEPRPKRRPSH
jgi:hypothetical protein